MYRDPQFFPDGQSQSFRLIKASLFLPFAMHRNISDHRNGFSPVVFPDHFRHPLSHRHRQAFLAAIFECPHPFPDQRGIGNSAAIYDPFTGGDSQTIFANLSVEYPGAHANGTIRFLKHFRLLQTNRADMIRYRYGECPLHRRRAKPASTKSRKQR